MKIYINILGTSIVTALFFCIVTTVNGAGPADAINFVGGSLAQTQDGANTGEILTAIVKSVLPLINLIAIVILIITGLILVIAQDDNQISTARKTLLSVAFALIGINIAGPLAIALSGGFTDGTGGSGSASLLSEEVLGIINFIEVPIAAIAIVMIVISGIRAIIAFGTEQGSTHLKRTIIAVASGLIILSAKMAITTATGANPLDVFIAGSPNATPLVNIMINIIKVVLSFMALAAVIMIITAGIMMVANKGDQDVAEKARNLISRTLIGLLVILISYGLAMVVI